MEQAPERKAGLLMGLLHRVGEAAQAFQMRFHGTQRLRSCFVDVSPQISAREALVGLLEVLNEGLLVGLRIVDQAAQFVQALLAKAVKNDIDRRGSFSHTNRTRLPRTT